MTVSLKHAFTSAKSDGGDNTLVQPSNWNAEHQLTLANNTVLGRNAGTDGAAQELSGSDLRTLTGLATSDSPQFTALNVGHATDTTIARVSAGVISVEGSNVILASNKLSALSATTSAELAGVISDETGSGALVFGTSPTLTTPVVTALNSGQLAGFRNAIINGAMMIAQRGTSFTSTDSANNDDTYNLDRWTLLSDGNDAVDVTQSTEAPTNGLNSIALDVETINKKFGIIQFIEQKNCIGLIGNTVTLSFKAKVSSTTKLDNVKCAILAWSGTADAVTSDVVSAWNVEGTNPTLATNWTYENTPANLSVTTSWATYSVSAAVDTASTKNIAVFIWSDVTDTTLGDFLYITDVQLEIGTQATPFEVRSLGTELALCQRYYQTFGVANNLYSSDVTSGSYYYFTRTFVVEMRVSPTIVQSSHYASGFPTTDATTSSTTKDVNFRKISDSTVNGGYYQFAFTASAEL